MTDAKLAVTKKDAVNRMLASIGQSPVNTLTGTLPKDVNKAVLALDNTTRDVCSNGWSFNQDKEYELSASSNRIAVPSNASIIESSYGYNYSVRWNDTENGLCLYNNDDNDFEFTGTVKVNVIWLFDFDELPQHARHYIAMRAGREYQATIVGSQILWRFTKEMEQDAWATFRRIEKRSKNYNINRYSTGAHRRFNAPRY